MKLDPIDKTCLVGFTLVGLVIAACVCWPQHMPPGYSLATDGIHYGWIQGTLEQQHWHQPYLSTTSKREAIRLAWESYNDMVHTTNWHIIPQ